MVQDCPASIRIVFFQDLQYRKIIHFVIMKPRAARNYLYFSNKAPAVRILKRSIKKIVLLAFWMHIGEFYKA